ncbi:MAG: phosphohistidine phosphatase SixA [Acidobacteria bacterium]|nr:phosphohistidine phosphatase SixA [Acidobacteriota bacterium]MBI3280702.1 phosphohistidine phosphatase SixA [Acidobacteriota bacterium]
MKLYILRHGIAEDGKPGSDDSERMLTALGRRKVKEVMRLAMKGELAPSLMVTSPYVRAVQTAETAADVLGYKNDLLRTQSLAPGSTPEAVWEELRAHKNQNEVMLVGHEPLLSQVVAYMLGAPSLAVDMKKGALVRIDLDSFGARPRGVLKWMLAPKLAG